MIMDYTIDLQNIADQLGFDVEDVKMIMDSFYDNAKISLQEMKIAIEANNFENIQNTSHAIKGSALNLLLNNIAKIAQNIEHNAIKKNKINYFKNYTELEALIYRLKGEHHGN